jgi:peptidoglycan/LPS O-acetylase OafA/YrhL
MRIFSAPMSATTLRYRPGLDGVRGLAVLGVLLYHGQVSWARGGFLGVDVFFVLSGYLITSLLLAEWRRWGSIDLRGFWLRRARRLLPALFLVLIGVSLYAALLASPAELDSIRKDSLATIAYVANWRFVLANQSYFDQYAEPSPLRHMWSLGIEEQFYLIFPLLLIGLLTIGARRRGLAAVFTLGAAGSALLAAALYAPGQDPSRVYYGTDTRLQALLVGAVAAVALWRDRPARPPEQAYLSVFGTELRMPGAAGVLGGLGLVGVLVLFGVARDSDGWLYQGGFLLVAVLAVALVVGAAGDTAVARLLGLTPLRQVGLISYGLYLWHWPVYVALTPARLGYAGGRLLAVRIAATLVLALASYVLVERPIRAGALGRRWSAAQRRPAVAASLVVVLVAVIASTAGAGGVAAPVTAAAAAASGPPPPQPPRPGDAVAYLVGDSVPYSLRIYYPQKDIPGLSVNGSTFLGCGLIPEQVAAGDQVKTLDPHCVPWSQQWPVEVAQQRPDVGVLFPGIGEQFDHVVGGQRLAFASPPFEQHLSSYLDTAVAQLGSAGARPVALVNVPCHDVPNFGLGSDAPVINDEQRIRWLDEAIGRYGRAHHVPVIDMYGFLCAGGKLKDFGGVKMRDDGLHFTPEGAAIVWKWLAPQLLSIAGR